MCSLPVVPSVVDLPDVFLHVGLYKTGTTTIQGALAATAEQLAAAGVLFPGGHRAQRLAAYDLLGQRVSGEQRGEAAGALGRLVDLVAAHDGPTVVISEEELSLARPRHARRLVRALAGHRVHVVVGARDPARTLVTTGHAGRHAAGALRRGVTPAPAPVRDRGGHPLPARRDDHPAARAAVRAPRVGEVVRPAAGRGAGTARPHRPRRPGRLVPAPVTASGPALDVVTDAELLGATQAALVSMALDHGRLFRRYRRAFAEREGRLRGPAEVLTSQLRAGGFWMKKRAVRQADRHPLLARASTLYLQRTWPTSRW